MSSYVAPGYWVSGYAVGDETLGSFVNDISYTLNQYEAVCIFPMIAFSDKTIAYSISPDLPSGMALNSVTGAITGSPNYLQDSTSYVIAATDTDNIGASATFTIEVVKDSANSIAEIDLVAVGLSRIALQYRSQP